MKALIKYECAHRIRKRRRKKLSELWMIPPVVASIV